MSWNIEIPIIVRTLINDLDSTNFTYSDDRILQVVSVAGKYVQLDVNLANQYDINVSTKTITPDPSVLNDDLFISLVSLKAACLCDQSAVRTRAAMEGIRASLGPASLQVVGNLTGLKMILEQGPCKAYAQLTDYWDIKEATAMRAILSPFVGNKFDSRYLDQYFGDRSRYFYS